MADDNSVSGSAGNAAASSAAPSTASSSPQTVVTAAPATGAPAPTTGTAQDPTAVSTGEPPKDRWPDILDNARKKTRAEVEKEFREKYGKYDQFETDPWGAVQTWLDQAATHSLYRDSVANYAAKLLQSRRGASTKAAEEPQPDVPIVNAQGVQTGMTYSAERLKQWREWDWAQKQAQLDERLRPLEDLRKSHEDAQTRQMLEAQAWTTQGERLERLRQTNPFFKEHEAAIKAEFMAHEEYADNVDAAAFTVLTRDVLPKLSQTEQQKVLDSLATKAAGATVNPGGSAPAGKPKFKNFREALEYHDAHPEEAKASLAR